MLSMDKYMSSALNHYREQLCPDTRHKLSVLVFEAGFESGEKLTEIVRKFRNILYNSINE